MSIRLILMLPVYLAGRRARATLPDPGLTSAA